MDEWGGKKATGPARRDEGAESHREFQLDPTKMINQPSFQQSKGAIWMVMGGLFLAASLVPFGALIFVGSGRSVTAATIFAVILLTLYGVLVLMRFVIANRLLRVRIMAVCMLSMAATALIGIWLCSVIENAALVGAG